MTTLAEQLERLAERATPGPIAVNPFSAYIDCTQLDEDGDPTPIAALAWPTKYRSEDETRANGDLLCLLVNNLPQIIAALKTVAREQQDWDNMIAALKAGEAEQ